jgi:hypothetical protein
MLSSSKLHVFVHLSNLLDIAGLRKPYTVFSVCLIDVRFRRWNPYSKRANICIKEKEKKKRKKKKVEENLKKFSYNKY